MPRAIGAFRKAGFPVEASPVDWRTRGIEDALHSFATMSEGSQRTDIGVHEWILGGLNRFNGSLAGGRSSNEQHADI
jgi:uncharacterized SAM-binding protein YcdF (DUF218 family)